jgi:hypothetical protein
LSVAAALSTPATAVPIPWKNCGSPGDLLRITQADASVWPPSVPAPARATATFDDAGNLVNLRLSLIHGVSWVFDSGPLPTTTDGAFVFLPASFPVGVVSPALPLPPGPYSTVHTFAANSAHPTTIVEHANVAAPIDAPVTTTVGLSTNGVPGFPLVPAAGTAYTVHVQMAESGGAKAFCLDLTEPLKTAAAFVAIQQASAVPALSRPAAILVLTLMLGVVAALGLRRRALSAHSAGKLA